MAGEEAKGSSQEKLRKKRRQKKRKYSEDEDVNDNQSVHKESNSQQILCVGKGSSKEKLQKKRRRKKRNDLEDEDVNDNQSVLKESNSQQILCVGTSCNLNERKKNILLSLSGLLPGLKAQITATDNQSEVLKNDKCPYGLYMEWVEDSFFIWASNCSKGDMVKFELVRAFGDADSEELNVKRPLLAFSHGFEDDAMWTNVKKFLLEMFGRSDSSTVDADYLYSFTRIGGKFQLCIYKISNMPASLQEDHMQLQRMDINFVLKPVQIHSADVVNFLEGGPEIKQGNDFLDLTPVSAYRDKSRMDTIPHMVKDFDIDCVMLPVLLDSTAWDGFNTTVSEFFQRYRAFDIRTVIGTGKSPCGKRKTTEAEYYEILLPFKVFARSLISRVGDTIESKTHSFEKISVEHVRFRGQTLAILGAKLIPYEDNCARRNLSEVGGILANQLMLLGIKKADFPPDLNSILQILEQEVIKPDFNLENYTLVKNSVVWMHGKERCAAMDELFGEFLYVLEADEQLKAGSNFSTWKVWHDKVRGNWLMDDCRMFGFPDNMNAKETAAFHAKRRKELRPLVANDDIARRLYNLQQCFKNIRNPFHHLHQSAKKMKIKEKLTRVDIDHTVSSCFAREYALAQREVPRVLALRDGKGPPEPPPDYGRFGSYFPTVKFGPWDQK